MKRSLWVVIWLILTTGCENQVISGEQNTQFTNTHVTEASFPASSATATVKAPIATATLSATQSFTPTQVCSDKHGWIEETSYPGVVSMEEIPLRIYYPPCYRQEEQRYPALYLLHGTTFDESQWDELGVDELVDEGIAAGNWPPFMIFMPLQPEPLFSHTDGGPRSYEIEMLEGLIPYVDRNYRTHPQPEARALGGISRGGIWALEIAFRNPQVFDIVAALSPALHVNNARALYDPLRIVRTDQPLPNRIFLSAGDQEWPFRESTQELSMVLDERGVTHTLVIGVGGHNNEAWMAVIGDMLGFIEIAWSGLY